MLDFAVQLDIHNHVIYRVEYNVPGVSQITADEYFYQLFPLSGKP